MKKTQKGFIIALIKISKDGYIEVANKEGELIKTTRAQRECITRHYKNRVKLISELKRAFDNDKIIDESVVINIDK